MYLKMLEKFVCIMYVVYFSFIFVVVELYFLELERGILCIFWNFSYANSQFGCIQLTVGCCAGISQ